MFNRIKGFFREELVIKKSDAVLICGAELINGVLAFKFIDKYYDTRTQLLATEDAYEDLKRSYGIEY